jgi:hypothetical protein
MVCYSAVLYGGVPYNYKFGFLFANHVLEETC